MEINKNILIKLPLEILQYIFDKLDFKSQVNFCHQCKYCCEALRINNNMSIKILPLEILQIIFDKLDFKSKLVFRKQCKYFYERLRIYNLYNLFLLKLSLDNKNLNKYDNSKNKIKL